MSSKKKHYVEIVWLKGRCIETYEGRDYDDTYNHYLRALDTYRSEIENDDMVVTFKEEEEEPGAE